MDLTSSEDKRAQRRAEREAKRAAAERNEVIQSLMQTQLGRAWVKDLLAFCCVFQTTFKGESTHASAFAEGQKNVGLRLLSEIMEACPEAYIQMMGEQYERRTEWDRTDPVDDRNWSNGEWIGDD